MIVNEKNIVDLFIDIVENNKKIIYPLDIMSYKIDNNKHDYDLILNLTYKDKNLQFFCNIFSYISPKKFSQILYQFKNNLMIKNYNVMVVIPYINKSLEKYIFDNKISCIDLNGNYIIQTESFVALRLDKKNRYKQNQTIKNIYSQNSSIVGRLLLYEQKIYNSVNEIFNQIKKLNGNISLSTVSKVLKILDSELIISKKNNKIKLLQPDKLLDLLKEKYQNPKITRKLFLKIPEGQNLEVLLNKIIGKDGWIYSGETSVNNYAVTSPINLKKIYIKNINQIYNEIINYQDKRFYNYIFYETESSFLFFNRNECWSSRIQCFLELSQLDKREKEIAENIAKDILKKGI